MEDEERSELLDDPTGGPSAGSVSSVGDRSDEAIDPSAGAEGQSPGEGAVEEADRTTGEDEKPTPG